MKTKGELTTKVTFNGTTKKLKLFVLKNTENLFGTDWIQEFNLWDLLINTFCQKVESLTMEKQSLKTELKKTFPEIFAAGLGKCTKTAAKFKLIDNAQPVFKKKRNVLFTSLEKINKELDRLVKTNILSKVELSQWAAPTVYVKKKSKEISVCADFSTGLNAVLIDYHYPHPSPEEVFTKLNGGKIFSKVDLSDAYLQIPVEENSSKLLCINTHRSLFKFERLPFRIKAVPMRAPMA